MKPKILTDSEILILALLVLVVFVGAITFIYEALSFLWGMK